MTTRGLYANAPRPRRPKPPPEFQVDDARLWARLLELGAEPQAELDVPRALARWRVAWSPLDSTGGGARFGPWFVTLAEAIADACAAWRRAPEPARVAVHAWICLRAIGVEIDPTLPHLAVVARTAVSDRFRARL